MIQTWQGYFVWACEEASYWLVWNAVGGGVYGLITSLAEPFKVLNRTKVVSRRCSWERNEVGLSLSILSGKLGVLETRCLAKREPTMAWLNVNCEPQPRGSTMLDLDIWAGLVGKGTGFFTASMFTF